MFIAAPVLDDYSYENVVKHSGIRGLFRRPGVPGQPDGLMTDEQIATVRTHIAKSCNGENGVYLLDGKPDRTGQCGLVLEKNVDRLQSLGLRKDVTGVAGMTSVVGLQGVPIVMPAQVLVPFPTPLRNSLPRRVTGGRTALWRQLVTPPVSTWPSVPEANGTNVTGRGANVVYNESNVSLTFASIARETFLTPEALFGGNSNITPGQDFNVAEVNRLFLLMNTYLGEEAVRLGGNVTDIGAPSAPTAAAVQPASTVGGLSTATAYDVQISALTLEGYGSAFGNTVLATGRVSGTDSAGETNAAAVTTFTTAASGAGSKAIAVEWTAVQGAVAYNAYIAAQSTSPKYVGTTTVNEYTFTTLGTPSTHTVNSADQTGNANDSNGLIHYCTGTGAGYFRSLNGAVLTSDGTTNVAEYKTAFKYFYDNYRTAPDVIYEGSGVMTQADQIVTGSTTPGFTRFIGSSEDGKAISGGLFVGDVKNPYGAKLGKPSVRRELHPLLPDGMALFVTNQLGPLYPNASIGANLQVLLGWDYRLDQFAKTQRTISQEGMDLNGALAVYANFALGAIVNIGEPA
ncbi:MAG: hypothetical protein EPN91_00450 [Salinibacterium sp.]|nr:MAG: hypothetical protein EPN91_00450 [Salinibacterium sp.]